MQIRCQHCHKPFGLAKEEVHAALDMLESEKHGHYNTQCPHCRNTNKVSRDDLLHAAPEWKKEHETAKAD
jgi:phage FluMu protein Com